MATSYAETPDNFREIEASVHSEVQSIKDIFFRAAEVLFYDACSFQRHSNLADEEKGILINYFYDQGIVIFITRCILMELAGDRHRLTEKCIDYINELHHKGVKVVILYEEDVYQILSECFSTIEKCNEYLTWAVRMVKTPVSTIEDTLRADAKLHSEIIAGKNLKASDLYQRFFSAVRGNKEHGDNLGEELIAICIYILSYLPGIGDGKLCVITDDKCAAGRINSVMKKTNPRNRGSKITIYSTPKLVQHMHQDQVKISEDNMVNILSQGTSGNISVMGITPFDLTVDEKISISCRELAQKIIEPNGITIVF